MADVDLYLPGLPKPTITPTSDGYWRAAAEGRLDVQRCTACGAHRHPPTEGCYRCRSLDWAWDTLPGTGTVFTYTWVTDPIIPAIEDRVPYNVAIVEVDGTDGEPVRVVSNVVDATPETLAVGERVTLHCEAVSNDFGLARFRLA
jgi:uncharacterized OB-fold protein